MRTDCRQGCHLSLYVEEQVCKLVQAEHAVLVLVLFETVPLSQLSFSTRNHEHEWRKY